jgi:SAM-dependent methyltransferase
MDWRLKCAAFHALNWLPKQEALHRWIQRRVTGRYYFDVTAAELSAYRFHIEHFPGGRALEFGSGTNLLAPLLLSAAGATEVLAYDIEPLAAVDRVNHVIRQLRGKVPGEWPTVADLSALVPKYRIRYCAPGDARHTDLPAGSVDFVCSTSTLEHIPLPAIEEILRECRRIASPRACFSFVIDYHDHYATADANITRCNFYRYGDLRWGFLNPRNHYQNRLRHSDYERAFAAAGLDMVVNRRILPPDSPIHFTSLARRFRGYSWEDLAALNGLFVVRPVGARTGVAK